MPSQKVKDQVLDLGVVLFRTTSIFMNEKSMNVRSSDDILS